MSRVTVFEAWSAAWPSSAWKLTVRVEVLGAVPAAGFTADVEAEDDGSTRVDFESEHHRSRLKVWWRDGPRHEVAEQGRDGGDERQDTDDDED